MLPTYAECGTIHLQHRNLLGATPRAKKTDCHKLPMILCGYCAGNYSHCGFMGAAALSYKNDAVSQLSFLSSGPYMLPTPSENEHLLPITPKAFIMPRFSIVYEVHACE